MRTKCKKAATHYEKDHKGSLNKCQAARISPKNDLPDFYRTRVQMHEIGGGIISHSARMQANGKLPNLFCPEPRNPDVYGTTFHVQAVFRYASRNSSQCRVGFRRAISRNDADRFGCLDFHDDAVEQIQQVRIHRLDFTGAVVPHDGADPTDRTVNQFAMGSVAGGKRFSRMDIIKGEDLMFWNANRHRSAGEKAQCGSGAHFKKSSPVGKKGYVAVHRRIFSDLSVLRASRLPAVAGSSFGSSEARTSFGKM